MLVISGLLAAGGCTTPENDSYVDGVEYAKWNVPLAYLNGYAVRRSDIDDLLIEAAGGRVFAEYVLNRMVRRELVRQGLELTAENIAREKEMFLRLLDDDLQVAAKLMTIQRDQQGPQRFDGFIVRQAGLRLLVQDEVEVSQAAVRQGYEFTYGPRYEIRLIVVGTLANAADVVKRVGGGEKFMDVAIEMSTDPSRAQGGLISPMSLVDPTYPVSFREAVEGLKVGQMSNPVLVDGGYAVVMLEQVLPAQDIKFEDVKAEMAAAARRRSEQIQIQRRARMMFSEIDLQIHDAGLRRSWEQQLESVLQ